MQDLIDRSITDKCHCTGRIEAKILTRASYNKRYKRLYETINVTVPTAQDPIVLPVTCIKLLIRSLFTLYYVRY